MLHESRKRLYSLPTDVLFELPGRPNVLYAIKDYRADKTAGAAECRSDMPFLFKAFETGQIGPRRLSRMVGENKPRNATIHEYLDWTVTGVEAKNEGEYVSSARAQLAGQPVCWLEAFRVERGDTTGGGGGQTIRLVRLAVCVCGGVLAGRPAPALAAWHASPRRVRAPQASWLAAWRAHG